MLDACGKEIQDSDSEFSSTSGRNPVSSEYEKSMKMFETYQRESISSRFSAARMRFSCFRGETGKMPKGKSSQLTGDLFSTRLLFSRHAYSRSKRRQTLPYIFYTQLGCKRNTIAGTA